MKKEKITEEDFSHEILDFALKVQQGDLAQRLPDNYTGVPGQICEAFNSAFSGIRKIAKINSDHKWLEERVKDFSALAKDQSDLKIVSQVFLSALVPWVSAQCGVLYGRTSIATDAPLALNASYGIAGSDTLQTEAIPGHGLIGQCAQDKQRILLTDVPPNYRKISSGTGGASPANLVILPVIFRNTVFAVLEIGTLGTFSTTQLALLEQAAEYMAVVFNDICARLRSEEIIEGSRALGVKLQIANAALEENNAKLAQVSKYKSEFLANMSHELRTPLGSLLVLSQKLAENADGNLSPKQATYSQSIHSSAEDLMNLINDILDLSKIEAGKMVIENSDIFFTEIKKFSERDFNQVAANKNLEFTVNLHPKLPVGIWADEKKLRQILRNLLSNAFKFTEKGSVILSIFPGEKEEKRIAFEVRDTGIGVAAHQKDAIFDAFEQGDSSLTRKYGGTGLGLSISRGLATLLGGEIRLENNENGGSVFTLFLPRPFMPAMATPSGQLVRLPAAKKISRSAGLTATIALSETEFFPPDDRERLSVNDTVLLLIEDDLFIVGTFLDLAHEHGFKGIVSTTGASGLKLAEKYHPGMIMLDLDLADSWGWVVLDKLKRNPETRSIPVGVICGGEKIHRAMQFAVKAHMRRPANRPELASMINRLALFRNIAKKRVLILANSESVKEKLNQILAYSDIEISAASDRESGLGLVKEKSAALIVVDFDGTPASVDFVSAIKSIPEIKTTPVVIYGEQGFTAGQKADFVKLSDSAAVQEVDNPDKLLEYSVLFMHRVEANLPEEKRVVLRRLAGDKSALKNKKIMIVDDDSRNIIAISSILEDLDMTILYAGAGKEALEHLKANADVDLVLMDIMMPEKDGFETTREIRRDKAFQSLPIIALTARGMKEDREKCLQAGASDFLPKPINMDQLIALLRVWLS